MDWSKIIFSKLVFSAELLEDFPAPEFLGNTLRGGFGQALHHAVCLYEKPVCVNCIYRESCVYAYIFNSVRSARLQARKNMQNYPCPFTIDPFLLNKDRFSKGEMIRFGLVIAGSGAEYMQFFISGFKNLGSRGLGKNKSKYKLLNAACAIDPSNILYHSESNTLSPGRVVYSMDDYFKTLEMRSSAVNEIEIDFITRTRFQKEYEDAGNVGDFEVLTEHLLERMELLSELYCNYCPELDRESILNHARQVQTTARDLVWEDIDYQSKSRQRQYRYGGFKGKMRFKGDLDFLIPFLRFGELFHVGHGTTRGYGRYQLTIL